MGNHKIMTMIAATILGGGYFIHAETIALWKLDYDSSYKAPDYRCLVNPGNDLQINGSAGVSGEAAFVGTPANLGSSAPLLYSAVNHTSVRFPSSFLFSSSPVPYLEMTNSWTIEGWFKREKNPTGSSWIYIFGTRDDVDDGWLFTLRLRNNVIRYEVFSYGAVNDGTLFNTEVLPDSTNVWQHLALTYDHDESGVPGKGSWRLYVDGTSYGCFTNNQTQVSAINTSDFFIGGRRKYNIRSSFSADYIRISNEALQPDGFLNARPPVLEPVKPASSTLAFWSFDCNAPLKNRTGDKRFDLLTDNNNAELSSEQAFDTVPNTTVNLRNNGSVCLMGTDSYLTAAGIGSLLETDCPFTIEGWVYRKPPPVGDWEFIVGTRTSGTGFVLNFNLNRIPEFGLYAFTSGSGIPLIADSKFPGSPSGEWMNTWRHIALTYNPSITNGVWELFVNGVSAGCLTNAFKPTASEKYNQTALYLGSRPNSALGCGCFDSFRVCSTILKPAQFLCAMQSPQAVEDTDVLAFWPLDSANGNVFIDGHDEKGTYPMTTRVNWTGIAAESTTNCAVSSVPNPDSAISGNPAWNNGSIKFPDITKPMFLRTKEKITDYLEVTNNFTVEGWFKLEKFPSNWYHLFSLRNVKTKKGWFLAVRILNGIPKIILFCDKSNATGNYIADNTVLGELSDADLNVWKHLALVYDKNKGNGTWTLFIDGEESGSAENLVPVSVVSSEFPAEPFSIGGRATGNSLQGSIDLMRISTRVLTPDEFLNAQNGWTPPSTDATRTLAYWKLDHDETGTDFTSQVDNRYSATAKGTVTGAVDLCRKQILHPDTSAGFIGDPAINRGSVGFSDSAFLAIPNLAYHLTGDRNFTAEGWMKWNGSAETQSQPILGTQFLHRFGWTLSLEKSGDGAFFRIIGEDSIGVRIVDGNFTVDKIELKNRWHHLALTYSGYREDFGTWELFLDGKSVGIVANKASSEDSFSDRTLTLGGSAYTGASFDGLLDTWRVVDGVLTPDKFLYVNVPSGLLMLLR